MHDLRTREAPAALACPHCGRANVGWARRCGACGGSLAPHAPRPAALEVPPPAPETVVRPVVVVGAGALLAPLFGLTPLLQYMVWFLGSLVHEIGHCACAWFFGQPAWPAIRLDGHAAAIHQDQRVFLVVLVGLGLAGLTWALRRRPRLGIPVAVVLACYPLLALTDAKEVLHLLAGHGSELAFAAIFLYRALSGGFTESTAERVGYATVALLLWGRNVILDVGLMTSAAARARYAGNGSFGLTNDFIRAGRELGISLEAVAGLMLVVALVTLPLGWWAWRRIDHGGTA